MKKMAYILCSCALSLTVASHWAAGSTPADVQVQHPQRHIALDGIYNLRDLGGYETSDGRSVRWGLLFRSSDLTDASTRDRTRLEALGISTICDLRNDSERASRTDPQLKQWQFDQKCHSAVSNTQGLKPSKDKPTDWQAVFTDFYRGVGKAYAPQYRAMFDNLKQNKSMLLHCTAGKDRTGVGSALILLALGVPRDTVVADYHLTDQYEAPATVMADHPELAGIAVLRQANPAYLNAALDGINTDYGSLDNYFATALNVSASDREQLRKYYLEPIPIY